MKQQRRVYVYIDETGDRGNSPKSSPIFGMAALVLDATGSEGVRDVVRRLRDDFRVPTDKVMSWKEYVKSHDRRRRAADQLAALDGVRVCHVYSVKSALRSGSYRDDQQRFYNYVAYKTYKSALWAARSWKGSGAEVRTRFGHVKGHDHRTTKQYIEREAAADPKVPFDMERGLRWVPADKYVESQAADLYGGFLKSALWPGGEFGYVEPAYLLRVWRQIQNSETCAIPLGIMSMPDYSLLKRVSWFPCVECPR